MNAAVAIAKNISSLVPQKPKAFLGGGEVGRQAQIAYGAAMAPARSAWQCAATEALHQAMSAPPPGWRIDHDNFSFIDGVSDLRDLEAMCDSGYPWSGRRSDQI